MDDLQSLFWVLIFAALHYVAHDNDSFLRVNHLFTSAERPPTLDPSDSDADGLAGKKRATLRRRLLDKISFRCVNFKELIAELCSDWNEFLLSGLMADEYDELRPRFKRIQDKVGSASLLANLLDDYWAKAGWEDNDIVLDQFPL